MIAQFLRRLERIHLETAYYHVLSGVNIHNMASIQQDNLIQKVNNQTAFILRNNVFTI